MYQQQQELLLISSVSGTTTFCISMEILFASATRGTITTGISNLKYYYFTSAWKYNLHQHQQELLLFASVSTTTNTCISIRIYYNLHQHVNSICISNNRNYYYLQKYQELLLLTSATAETTTTCCSIRNICQTTG